MTLDEVMNKLKSLGSEKMREMNARHGAGENQFGIKSGDLRVVAKSIKTIPELAPALWKTGNDDAMRLATLLMKPKEISAEDLENMVREATVVPVADWLVSYIVKLHPMKEQLRQKWMQSSDLMLSRAGWSLTTERVIKSPEGLDPAALLDRIDSEMADAPEKVKWTMNFCLGEIGINFPELRERAIAIGERIGAYRDWPLSKGCVPPYVPVWVKEMVGRQG